MVARTLVHGETCENCHAGYGIGFPGQVIEPWSAPEWLEEIYIILRGKIRLHYQPGPGFFTASKDKFVELKEGDMCALPGGYWFWVEIIGTDMNILAYVMVPPVKGPIFKSGKKK